MHEGKRKTYIDDEIQKKKLVIQAPFYEISRDLVQKNHKSFLNKAQRKTLADDIASYEKRNSFPAPGSHNPNRSSVDKKDLSCVTFKGARVSFVNDA
jgi:hypothetical protein